VTQGSYYWRPGDGNGVHLEPPVAANSDGSRVPEMPKVPEKPRVRDERDLSPAFPVGIPQFAIAKEGVASGLRPSIEGLDWLKDNGYRTVLQVRRPGEDDAADRKQVSKRGLKYVSLEVSPETLSRQMVADFSKVVEDTGGRPLFVYDKDGMLAGGLWYLYFRTVEKDSDETARVKAARLGLSEAAEGDHKTMWLAIQKYLSEQKP
jgi:protein tyrosine phosphatase (PTP) superfamily phosphohydrolase (DUF442 family)